MPADEVELAYAVEEKDPAADGTPPAAAVNPTMLTGPYFPVPEPAPTRAMIQLGRNMRVPLDSVTLIDDDEEVAAAPPEPSRPKWVVSP